MCEKVETQEEWLKSEDLNDISRPCETMKCSVHVQFSLFSWICVFFVCSEFRKQQLTEGTLRLIVEAKTQYAAPGFLIDPQTAQLAA